jgi:predicted transport protein
MALYRIDKKLTHIKDVPFKLEREIQQLTEGNLDVLLNLDFIKSEFALNNFRMDTLAFDNESKAFVIIEYKRDKTFSVIDQGYAYLSLMLNNKADFILEYNESKSKSLKRNDVDWSQSKVIFVSPSFTSYQREAINFKDLPIELWEIKKFENNTLSFEQIQKTTAKESIKTISKTDEIIEKVSKEVIVFSEQDHLQKSETEIQELYEQIKGRILSMDDDISMHPKKQTIDFRIHKNIVCDVILLTSSLKIILNLKRGDLQDSKKIARDISDIGHWGNGSYEIKISDNEDIDHILSLINQSLKKNK